MSMSNQLPKGFSQKCTSCNSYLSIPPITVSQQGYKCGRCGPVTSNDSCFYAKAYEELAKLFKFPCKYEKFGCKTCLNFGSALGEHEEKCEFEPFKCPAIQCSHLISYNGILNHFNKTHTNLIERKTFFVPQRDELRVNKLVIIENNCYILAICNLKNHDCTIGLYNLKKIPDQEILKFSFKIMALDGDKKSVSLPQQELVLYDPSRHYTLPNMVLFNFETIKTLLTSANIRFEVDFEKIMKTVPKEKPKNIEKKLNSLLDDLECPICKEYMIPPIYICKTGHSLCLTCRKQIIACPYCQAPYEGTRNLVLEKLTERIEYPCKNRSIGCEFVGVTASIKLHEAVCNVNMIPCPLAEQEQCTIKTSLDNVYDHVKLEHKHYLCTMPTPTLNYIIFVNSPIMFFITKFEKISFRIGIKQFDDNCIGWCVEEIGLLQKKKSRYLFVIMFSTKNGQALEVTQFCKRYSDKFDENRFVKIPVSLLKPFVEADKVLSFRVNLKKIKN